jgi:hypothetical protein
VIGNEAGKASALKMCFAAKSKGTTALLCAVLAAAEKLDVRQELEMQWTHYDPEFIAQTQQSISAATAKAWRFSGEMEEIAATFIAAGIPGDFHQGAREIYQRLACFKDTPETPALAEVLNILLQQG